jgi:hypothetical protein
MKSPERRFTQSPHEPLAGPERDRIRQSATRRQFLEDCMSGLGGVALASLLDESLLSSAAGASVGPALGGPQTHFPPKVKNVIFLHMAGAPSQIDLFDPKPKLRELHGQEGIRTTFW